MKSILILLGMALSATEDNATVEEKADPLTLENQVLHIGLCRGPAPFGHLFVNIAETRQPLKVNLDTRNAPAADSYAASVYRSTEGEAFRPLWQSQRGPKEFAAELEPLEVVFVELSGPGQG